MRAVAQHPEASAPNSIPFTPTDGRENMKALVQEIPVPQLGENDILVKVAYAAQNPTDYKHSQCMAPPKALIGCDFSGTVVSLGEGLRNSSIKVGDKVAGAVHGGLYQNKGSYAEYLKVQSDLVFKVPGSMSLEKAATFGVPWLTAGQILALNQGKKLPPAKVGDEWILIYGGSTSVGLFALQLAKAMGYKVVSTASPHSFDLVKEYGADEVVDYKDGPAASKKIKEITGGGVNLGIDCISEGGSFKICLDAFKDGPGQLNLVLPPSEEATKIREDIKMPFTLMYTLFGKDFNMTPMGGDSTTPAPKEDWDFGIEFAGKTAELIEKYGIKPLPTRVRGGLEDVTKGWEDQEAGKVSGVKLVYKIE